LHDWIKKYEKKKIVTAYAQSESSSPLADSRKPSKPAQSPKAFFKFPSPALGSSKLEECSPSGTASAVASPQHDPLLPCADAGDIATAAKADRAKTVASAATAIVVIFFLDAIFLAVDEICA
jgi:hypothetical protein